ncbi:hypothetical protein C8Q75DRAFT_816028 [Abortiporus biennis]|nr:hypothetical protein C8Q75DRAFT_732533 [Abortiporus biennis]KAI0790901.1 hypothetical protein C8Q75DRAFT_816028 [Abortiporus biennis]
MVSSDQENWFGVNIPWKKYWVTNLVSDIPTLESYPVSWAVPAHPSVSDSLLPPLLACPFSHHFGVDISPFYPLISVFINIPLLTSSRHTSSRTDWAHGLFLRLDLEGKGKAANLKSLSTISEDGTSPRRSEDFDDSLKDLVHVIPIDLNSPSKPLLAPGKIAKQNFIHSISTFCFDTCNWRAMVDQGGRSKIHVSLGRCISIQTDTIPTKIIYVNYRRCFTADHRELRSSKSIRCLSIY